MQIATEMAPARSCAPLEVAENADEMQRVCSDIRLLQNQFQELAGKLQAHVERTAERKHRHLVDSQSFEHRFESLEIESELCEAIDAKIQKASRWGQKVMNDSINALHEEMATLKDDVNSTKMAKSWPSQNFPEELKELLLSLETKLHDELQATTESIEVQMQLMEEKLWHAVHEIGTIKAVVEDRCRPSEPTHQNGTNAAESSASPWVGSDVVTMPSGNAHPRVAHMSRVPNARYKCMGL